MDMKHNPEKQKRESFSCDSLDTQLKRALKCAEPAPPRLNRQIEEALQKERTKSRRISLWFLPALANALFWVTAAFLSSLFLDGTLLGKAVLGWCGYMVFSGAALTVVAYFYTNLKDDLSIKIFKRRNPYVV